MLKVQPMHQSSKEVDDTLRDFLREEETSADCLAICNKRGVDLEIMTWSGNEYRRRKANLVTAIAALNPNIF